MSGLLDGMVNGFERRMNVRRMMLAHFGVSLTEETAAEFRDDVRATLLACGSCKGPDLCECWVKQQKTDAPTFCRARDAFHRLAAASADTKATDWTDA